MPKVGIIMGSDSDLAIMKEAGDMLSELGISMNIKFVRLIVYLMRQLNMLLMLKKKVLM